MSSMAVLQGPERARLENVKNTRSVHLVVFLGAAIKVRGNLIKYVLIQHVLIFRGFPCPLAECGLSTTTSITIFLWSVENLKIIIILFK